MSEDFISTGHGNAHLMVLPHWLCILLLWFAKWKKNLLFSCGSKDSVAIQINWVIIVILPAFYDSYRLLNKNISFPFLLLWWVVNSSITLLCIWPWYLKNTIWPARIANCYEQESMLLFWTTIGIGHMFNYSVIDKPILPNNSSSTSMFSLSFVLRVLFINRSWKRVGRL